MEFLVFIRGSVGKNLAISQEADTFIVRPATKLKMAAINVRFFLFNCILLTTGIALFLSS